MKKITLCIFLLNFLFGFGFTDSCQNIEIDSYLNRANSFHWLSRVRQNSYHEAKLSQLCLDSAKKILFSTSLEKNCKLDYLRTINSFENQLNELIEVTADNVNGVYPLIPFLTDQYSGFEYYDEPLEIAAESSLSTLLESGIYKPSKELKNVLLYCILDIKGDLALKEVAIQYLNNNSKMYVISDHEISVILGRSEIDGVEDLKKIGDFFNTKYLGKVSVIEYDNSNSVSYIGTKFEFFDLVKNIKISDTYSEGFNVDMRGKTMSFLFYFSPFLLVSFIFGILVFMILKTRMGQLGSILNLVLSLCIGFFLGLVCSFGIIEGLSLIAPEGKDYLGEPLVMIWSYLLTELIVITPVLLFVLLGLIVKRRFSDSLPLIFIFLFSASVAVILPILKGTFIYIDQEPNFILVLVYFVGALSISLGSAYWMAKGYKKNKNYLFLLAPSLLFIPLGAVLHELLRAGGVLEPKQFESIALSFVSVTGVVPFILFRTKKNKSSIEFPEMEKDETQLLKLKKIISFQLNDLDKTILVDFKEEFENKIKKIVSDSKGITHLHLDGESGIGKTTFLKSFINKNKSSFHSFYGDCDENQEGATIPYEPFHEAFGEFIGEGVFYKGNKAALDFIDKASPLLSVVGVDGIAEPLKSNESSFEGASTGEIVQGVINYILNLTKKQGDLDILFIIEDVHWIDNYTKKLFEVFLEQLTRLNFSKFGTSKIIILTTTSEKDNENCKDIMQNSLDLMKKSKYFSFNNWEDINDKEMKIINIINPKFLKIFLLYSNTGVHISSKTIEEIDEFISQTGSSNPRYILELMKFLIDKEMFVENNKVITLNPDIDWDTIPAENRMEELYYTKFSGLSEDVIKVLGCATFIGMEFEANLLSKLWKIDRLELIHSLLKAERSGVIIDLNDNDDYYRFSSKSIRAALKRFVLFNKSTKGVMPQIVKEYHKEIINITLSEYDINENPRNIAKLTNDQLFQLAERTILVYADYPEKGRLVCSEALKRALSKGENGDVINYLTFMSKMNFEFIFNSYESTFYFLTAIQRTISSDPQKFSMIFNRNLTNFLEKKILDDHADDSTNLMIETYGEIALKISNQATQFELLRSKYSENSFVRLYNTLIKARENSGKFSDSDINDLTDLWDTVRDSEEINLKSKLLGVLSRTCSKKESIYYIEQRINLISPNSLFPGNYLETIQSLDDQIHTFELQQLEDLGFISASFNQFLANENLIKEQYRLNRFRLRINTKLNHRLGIFLSSMELVKYPELFEQVDWFEFIENLFYQYPENSFRIQIYPMWLSTIIKMNKFNLIIEIATPTQMMSEMVAQPNFLSEDELKFVHISKKNLQKVVENEKIPRNEKSVIKAILPYSK